MACSWKKFSCKCFEEGSCRRRTVTHFMGLDFMTRDLRGMCSPWVGWLWFEGAKRRVGWKTQEISVNQVSYKIGTLMLEIPMWMVSLLIGQKEVATFFSLDHIKFNVGCFTLSGIKRRQSPCWISRSSLRHQSIHCASERLAIEVIVRVIQKP
jgi:hypothetical protein